jgi:aromatic-L-amino-acid/L-tryptophan decarboxylase
MSAPRLRRSVSWTTCSLRQEATNYVDFGPQNSRGFRALKVWLALRQVGRDGYVKMFGDDIRLSRWLAERVEAHDELELLTQNLSVATFRYVPQDLAAPPGPRQGVELYLDRLNQELLDRIQRSGEAFVSNAVVRDHYVLRTCIVNFRTSQLDLAALIDTVVRLGRQVDASLRASLASASSSSTRTFGEPTGLRTGASVRSGADDPRVDVQASPDS